MSRPTFIPWQPKRLAATIPYTISPGAGEHDLVGALDHVESVLYDVNQAKLFIALLEAVRVTDAAIEKMKNSQPKYLQ